MSEKVMANNQTHPSAAGVNRREVVVQMRGVSRYFDKPRVVRALNQVSVEIRRGEVFGLLGPGGAGKSTALAILAGRLAVSEGKVRVLGHSPRGRALKRCIAYLPQDLASAGSPAFSKAGSFLKSLFGHAPARNQKVSAESLDKARRAALKQILLRPAEVVVLDQPFWGSEGAGCGEMGEFIRTLAQQGRTVILSSRSLAEAKDVCTRMALMYRGEIEATGTLADLLARPECLRYIGEVLPEATGERVREMIRQELGVSELSGNAAPESPGTQLAGENAEKLLAPLTNVARPEPSVATQQ
ncbi:MAG: ATP-binding cassette domain-containing protein, partial [Limisphaerales bacterium]